MRAKILKFNTESVAIAKSRLLHGQLVAFPTETVYGLGAAITSEGALRSVFETKGRPQTDPLIVHVISIAMAERVADLSSPAVRKMFDVLTSRFWPGPLTCVVQRQKNISPLLTAGTEFVGIRYPANKQAIELIKACGVPLAAPSANKFGHVSPTSAQHVFYDFRKNDVLILDGGNCEVGIESTVAKITESGVEILRPGKISKSEIEGELQKAGLNVAVSVVHRFSTDLKEAQSAPGQLLKHYAPAKPTYLVEVSDTVDANATGKTLDKCVVIDFAQQLKSLENKFFDYRDLSPTANLNEASFRLFDFLRWAESCGAEFVLLPRVSADHADESVAIMDRIYRAASGNLAKINRDEDRVFF